MEWSGCVHQEEPKHPHVKDEEEEVCIKHKDTDIIAVIIKSEEDEERLESIQFHYQSQKEKNLEGFGATEPAWNSGPDRHVALHAEKMS